MTDPTTERAALAPVVLVTGKGGVGKRVLGRKSRVEHVVIRPQEAIQRIASDLFGSGLLARVVIGNFAMRRLLRAAPAIRELAQLECVRLAAAERPGKRVVVDMPATGHGIAWLRVPAQLRDMLRSGPLHRMAERLTTDLVRPDRCSVVVVTLPERLVLRETIELCEAMVEQVSLPPARLVINRVPPPLPDHALRAATRLSTAGGPAAGAAAVLRETLATRDQARGEAVDAMRQAAEELDLVPVVLPDRAVDPDAIEVAGWLEAEEAA